MNKLFHPTLPCDSLLFGFTTLTLLTLLQQTRLPPREERRAFYDFKRPRRKKGTQHCRNKTFHPYTQKA